MKHFYTWCFFSHANALLLIYFSHEKHIWNCSLYNSVIIHEMCRILLGNSSEIIFLKQNKTLIAVLLFNAVNWSSCLQHFFNNTDITTMCFIKEALDEFLIDFYEMIVK